MMAKLSMIVPTYKRSNLVYELFENIENQKLNGEKIEVYGYPTMFKIHNGHIDYYGGNRTASEMYNWVKGNISGGYSKSKIRKSNLNIKSK